MIHNNRKFGLVQGRPKFNLSDICSICSLYSMYKMWCLRMLYLNDNLICTVQYVLVQYLLLDDETVSACSSAWCTYSTKFLCPNPVCVKDPSLMPVTATVLKKGSTIPGEEFACAQVNLSFFHIHENAKIRHIFNHCAKCCIQVRLI